MRLRVRARIASLLDASGAGSWILAARARAGTPWLTALTYHRVRETPGSGGFDDGVVDATAAEFEEHIRLLSRDFTFVGVDDVRRWNDGGSLPRNPILVCFDDAYRECHSLVLPILVRHGARAAFFVPTAPVEERRLFWWDRASYILGRARIARATLPRFAESQGGFVIDLTSEAARAATVRRALRLIKDEFGLAIDGFLEALAEACEVHLPLAAERALADETVCTWEQLRALRSAGMDVQSHTRTHRVLQTLTPEALADELAGSREELEAQLREPVRTLAYPTGKPIGPRRDIIDAVVRAGYQLAFENVGGVNPRFLRNDALRMRRIPMPADTSGTRFQTLLAMPQLL